MAGGRRDKDDRKKSIRVDFIHHCPVTFCLRWVTSSVKLDRPRSGFSLVKIPREGRAAENRGARTVAKRGSDGRAAKHGGKSDIQNGGGKQSSTKSSSSKNRSWGNKSNYWQLYTKYSVRRSYAQVLPKNKVGEWKHIFFYVHVGSLNRGKVVSLSYNLPLFLYFTNRGHGWRSMVRLWKS